MLAGGDGTMAGRKNVMALRISMLFLRVLVLASGCALAVVAPCATAADRADDALTLKTAKIGFGGKFKAGFWQPVRLTVVAGSLGARGRLELMISDGDQAPVVYYDSSRGDV